MEGPGGSGMDEGDVALQSDEASIDARMSDDQSDSELAPLPIGDNSLMNSERSLLQRTDHHSDEGASIDEREMRRHFMDVESSFLPQSGPSPPQAEHPGVDDTYLELGQPGRTPAVKRKNSSASASQNAGDADWAEEDWERAGAVEDETTSSPAAAALKRTHERNAFSPDGADSAPVSSSSREGSRAATPGERPVSKGSTIRPEDSPVGENEGTEGGPQQSQTRRQRPSYLNDRRASRNSSLSSATMSSFSSDASGDISRLGGSHRNQFLSRLPSLGSVMSGVDSVPSISRGVSARSVMAGLRRGLEGLDEERPETPRAGANNADAPTDTVVAQHVQSIQVPETIARDFRDRNGDLSPGKQRPASSGTQSGSAFQASLPRRTMTLKEQNGKIDKLTKENFDLKLKIHFLDQALQSRSDDGVKELIDKNVQFQTDLANERKESQSLRRKMRELERQVREQAAALEQHASKPDYEEDDPTLQAEMHEEILYLRQQLDHSENRVTSLTEDVLTKELEKRKMADHMRSMAGTRGEESTGMKETMDMWQDLLNAETGRREQAEEDIRKLREELTMLRIERASPAPMSRARKPDTDEASELESAVNGSHAMVEQLKHENAELRRDLGAQTSMLTSRNRERERLQQEIEDLKLLHRKSDGGARSVASESIFERSISRAHQRAPSRASEAPTSVTEAERDDWDKKEGQLRDQNADLRLRLQELERTHNTHVQYVSVLEGDYQEMENELRGAAEDLETLSGERDGALQERNEALQAVEDRERDYQKLEEEALTEIDKLEKEMESLQRQLDEAWKKQHKTQSKLEHTTDGYKGLQGEVREITQSVMNLEDEKQANLRSIQTLEEQLAETEDELQKWEEKCKETEQKNRKLEITQESLHAEITFLREEQEGDKIKIGELEDALNAAHQMVQDEQEKLREVEQGIAEERQQRDVLENRSKEEVQRVLDDLNTDGQKTKDEVRKLRRQLSAKEVEAGSWKQKLEELEQSLRYVIGDPNGTKQSLLADIEKLQRELEVTANRLDRAKMDLADKDRLLRHRDGLLESTSLESRRLSDLLDKERASRRHDLEQFERNSRGQATHMRTIAQQESRVLELEAVHTRDQRQMAAREEQYREQLAQRNSLLLALWNRLSTLCGVDWAQGHSLVDGEVPSADVIARRLPAFHRNLLAAVQTIEGLLAAFKKRVRGVEKDLWRDYQTLEHNLDRRMRRMDALEQAMHEAQRAAAERPVVTRASSGSVKGSQEIAQLKSEVKTLKAELKFHRAHPSPLAQQMVNQSVQAHMRPEQARRMSSMTGGSSGKTTASPARSLMSNLLRHHSTSAPEAPHAAVPAPATRELERPRSRSQSSRASMASEGPPPAAGAGEQRWVHRLNELERRLKAEREARLLDRQGARKRLEEGRAENDELRLMLEHERVRREALGEGADEGEMAGRDDGARERDEGSGSVD